MTDELQDRTGGAFTRPTWVAVIQAASIGLIAGLVLNALVAFAGVPASGATAPPEAPRECKKSSPAKEPVSPKVDQAPAASLRS